MKKSKMCALAALAGCGVLTSALDAFAADCGTYPNPVYIAGSSASKPIWAALAAANALPGVSMIYQAPSSCIGLADVMGATPDTTSAVFMDGSASGVACTNPGTINIGVSDVFATTCPNTSVLAGFQDFQGPVQVMVMVVPYASTASVISADAAYTVFGWGGLEYPVDPWTNYTNIFIRSSTSGTELMIGSAIGLAASKWLTGGAIPEAGAAQHEANSGAVVTALLAAASGASPDTALGIVAADLGDEDRGPPGTNDAGPTGGLKILAYQAADQSCGYLPDSDATHFDKINVRQGRYDIWGPLHLVTAVDGSGNATNAQAATKPATLTANGLTDTQLQTLIQSDAAAHVVPQCAMQVSRSGEVTPIAGGGIASYQPPEGCGCYYESLKNGGTPYSKYCTPCGAGCAAPYPVCHFGFCEAQ